MRIAIDGMPLASKKTGIGHYTFELAKSLASIAPSDDFTVITPIPLEPSVADDFERVPLVNLHVCCLAPRLLNRRWWSVGLPLYLRRSSFDLFHGTNYDIPLWGHVPTVLTIHDLSLLLQREVHEQHLVRRARRRLPLMARAASTIVTPTQSVKREVCDHLRIDPDKIVVTPEAPRRIFERIDINKTGEVRKRLGIKDNFILFVGTIEPRKNLLRLVQAFEHIVRTTSLRPQLVIAGKKGWLGDEVFAYVTKSNLNDRVSFTGYLHDEDLCALYSSCSLFVYPSLYEGFGLPPLEAMACGAPVVTSKIPAIEEVVNGAARLIDPNSVEELATCLQQLLIDEEARRQLCVKAVERVRNFTWERTAKCTLQAYRDTLEKRR
jgi:glycosyltransferase involved in cell wall biosynthesis